jgi:hypothetical protein
VFADDDDQLVEVLDEAECLALLRSASIGRVAFTEGALPAIQPVPFRLDGRQVLIPTRSGSRVAGASRGAVLALGVDEVGPDRTGWAVTVVGPSRLIGDPADVAALDRPGLRWWDLADDRCYVAIAVLLVRGRRAGRAAPSPGVRAVPSSPHHGQHGPGVPPR